MFLCIVHETFKAKGNDARKVRETQRCRHFFTCSNSKFCVGLSLGEKSKNMSFLLKTYTSQCCSRSHSFDFWEYAFFLFISYMNTVINQHAYTHTELDQREP